jgi:glycosyltransferase involved in cell wall biosynthesis
MTRYHPPLPTTAFARPSVAGAASEARPVARVVQFVNNFDIGGTERQVVNLTRGLVNVGFDIRLACFRPAGGLEDEMRRLGVPIAEFPISSLRDPRAAKPIYDVARYLRRNRVDLVHTSGFYTNVLAVLGAWLAGTPVIISSVRDMGHMWTPAQRRVQRIVGVLADAVVTNADAVAARLRVEGWDMRRVEVIHNGIEYRRETPAPDLRRELGLDRETPLVGMVSRLTRLKGVEDFLDAAAQVAARHPRAHFAIVGGAVPDDSHLGERAYTSELAQRARRLGVADRLHFTGWRTDASALLRQFTISVLPSWSEGLSNVLIESLAAGIPTVTTDVGGSSEVVEHAVSGLLVPKADPGRLAAAIEQLLDHPDQAAAFGRAGRLRYEQNFTVDRMVQQMVRLYRRLLGREPARRPIQRALSAARGVRR